MKINYLLFIVVMLTGCSSSQSVDDVIDLKLEAYNIIKLSLCSKDVSDYRYFNNSKLTMISYNCGSKYNSSRIHLDKSEDKTAVNKLAGEFIRFTDVKSYSGWTLRELIELNSDYAEFYDNLDLSNISLSSGSAIAYGFQVKNAYRVSLIANPNDEKKDLMDMHQKTIDYLHRFQSFSCNDEPLHIHNIEWIKYNYNASSAKLSCNGEIYNISNYADDLNLEKFSAEQILFN